MPDGSPYTGNVHRRILAILAGYALLAAVRIREPLIYHGDGNGAQEGKHALAFRNHLAASRGILLDVSGPRLDRYARIEDQSYPDHPPLPALALAGLFAIFGEHDWVVRLLGHLFALGILAVVFLLTRKLYGDATALAAAGILAAMPMFAYFSSVTVHQAPTVFFALAGFLAWLHRRIALTLVCQFLACYSDWPGYYLGVALFLHAFFVERRRRIAWVFPAACVAFFGVYLLHVSLAGEPALQRLWAILRLRSETMPVLDYAKSEAREAALYFTGAVAIAAGLWIVRKREPGDAALLCLPVLALDELWLQNICFFHDYYLYPLAPFLAIASARTAVTLRKPALVAALAVLFVAQSAWILHRRMTRPDVYARSARLGEEIRRRAAPEDRVLVVGDDFPYTTAWYSRRYVARLNRDGILHSDAMGPWRRATLEEALSEPYDWIVLDGEFRRR